jgi:hypothetical protein
MGVTKMIPLRREPLALNMRTVALIVAYMSEQFDFSRFLRLRLVCKDFNDCIDNYAFDTWRRLLCCNHIEAAFRKPNYYIIKNALLTGRLNYHTTISMKECFMMNNDPRIDQLVLSIDRSYLNCETNWNGDFDCTPLSHSFETRTSGEYVSYSTTEQTLRACSDRFPL